MGLAILPEAVGDAGINLPQLSQARRYAKDPRVRPAVLATVLNSLRTTVGPLVIIAHSLGSVVAADLILRLPPSLWARLLITVGSPLGFVPLLRNASKPLTRPQFPADRLKSWVNLYDPLLRELAESGHVTRRALDPGPS